MFKVCECRILDLGRIPYEKALHLQKNIANDVIRGHAPNTIITCEHPSVITCSRLSKKENILASDKELKRLGVKVCSTDRGGDVTYHGPGQLVLYPIFDLKQSKKDLHLYLRKLEQVVIGTLRDNFGLNAYRKSGFTGVWVGPYKVASIGIGVRNWVTYHGLSLNVKVDKKYFSLLKSCGLDVTMASLNDFFDDFVSLETMRGLLLEEFKDVFGLEVNGG